MTAFAEEQAELARRIARGEARSIFIDPHGTLPDWLFVVVRSGTGVVYATQCAGIATEVRRVEGFLVPLGGSKFDVDDGSIQIDSLREVFHQDGYCQYSWTGLALPAERARELTRLVESIPYWRCDERGGGEKAALILDAVRAGEIAEGWIPVMTPDGAGVLLYCNCD